MPIETGLKCIGCRKFKLDSETSATIPVVNGGFCGRRVCSAGGWANEQDGCEKPEEYKDIGEYLEAILTPAHYIVPQTTGQLLISIL